MHLIPLLLVLLPVSTFGYAATYPALIKFKSTITPIPESTQEKMKKSTWKPNCPVSLDNSAEIKITYWGFDNKSHQGVLIVNKSLAMEVVSIFKAAYEHKFPIERMEPMENFNGGDDAAMSVNNTSAFNCRAITDKPGVFSKHSYGTAIDINTLINPYVKGDKILPPAGKKYLIRNQDVPGIITKNSFIYNEFVKRGWDWGGNWHDLQDYQHFEKSMVNSKRNPYGTATR